MPSTYEPIASTTLSSGASTIVFNSISSAYTDLRIVAVGLRPSPGDSQFGIRFNSDSGANYSYTTLTGSGTAASSSRLAGASLIDLTAANMSTTNTQFVTVDIFSYAGSKFKSCLSTNSQDNNGSGLLNRQAGIWKNTSAINSITILNTYLSNFNAGTRVTIYGIKAA